MLQKTLCCGLSANLRSTLLSRFSSRQRRSSTAPTLRTPKAAAAAASSAAASASIAAAPLLPCAESSHCRLHRAVHRIDTAPLCPHSWLPLQCIQQGPMPVAASVHDLVLRAHKKTRQGSQEVPRLGPHQVCERGSQTERSAEPVLSSARRKSSRSALPRKPPYVNMYGPTAATACRHRLQAATGICHSVCCELHLSVRLAHLPPASLLAVL